MSILKRKKENFSQFDSLKALVSLLTKRVIQIAIFLCSVIIILGCKKGENENDNIQPLACKIISPKDHALIPQGDTVRIQVSFKGTEEGFIVKSLFIDSHYSQLIESSPYYYYDWNTYEEDTGKHNIYVEYYGEDLSGATTDAVIVTITLGNFPYADFSADVESGIAPLTVQFTDLSNNSPTNWHWDFGDGNSSTLQHPTHTYLETGNYSVRLTTGNSSGQSTEEKHNLITLILENPCPETPTIDYHGHVYNTIQIGEQCWMKENLRWDTGVNWCFNDIQENCEIYGRLYNWHTIMNGAVSSDSVPSGVQGICPDGWHLPSNQEWSNLVEYLGGQNVAGGKLKAAGYLHWNEPNEGASNESGFTALPAGIRSEANSFSRLNDYTRYWTCTKNWIWNANVWSLFKDYQYMRWFKEEYSSGSSVRCLKDY